MNTLPVAILAAVLATVVLVLGVCLWYTRKQLALARTHSVPAGEGQAVTMSRTRSGRSRSLGNLPAAAIAGLDQSVATIDEKVAYYTRQITAMIDQHGKAAAMANFNRWLMAQPASAVSALAAGALARLAAIDGTSNDHVGATPNI